MRSIVVGGAGAMGAVVASDLARSPNVDLVTVADLDDARAARLAGDLRGKDASGHGARIESVGADVRSPGFADLLGDHDVCVASVAYRLNPTIAEACLKAKCGYVDLGGLFHVARETLAFDRRYRAAGVTGVTCMGGSPGITNLLAVVGARELDEVHAVHVRLGVFDPPVAGLPLPIPYSLETLLDEFSLPAMALHQGRFVEIEPLGEPESVIFPDPIGTRTAYTTLHSEVATLPRAFPAAQEVTFKIAFDPGFVERFKLLSAIGLASSEPVQVGGQLVRPRDLLVALGHRLPQAEGIEDVECLRVVLEGQRAGRALTVVAECLARPNPDLGLGGGALDTGVPPSIVAQMIAAGESRGPGMLTPEEAVDPDPFFDRLAQRGIRYEVRAIGRAR